MNRPGSHDIFLIMDWRLCWCTILLLSSCGISNQSILFRVSDHQHILQDSVQRVTENYLIQPYDQLEIRVYTNRGEQLIDPIEPLPQSTQRVAETPAYTVQEDGRLHLPMVGWVEVQGMSLPQLEELLTSKYATYYKSPFISTSFQNKRAIVLGASREKVIPLRNQGMNLIEVLALAGAFEEPGRTQDIRLIRGDLQDPEVKVIDLSTIEGLKKANLQVEPNDIIYVQPVNRPLAGWREFAPIVGAITSILAVIVVWAR